MRFEELTCDFGDIDAEVAACRDSSALFDFSFMSRGAVSGPTARQSVQALTSRRLDSLRPGRIAYGLRTDRRGYVLADLTVWRTGVERYEVFSGRRDDIAALVDGDDLSATSCVLSVQGPRCLRALSGLAAVAPLAELGYFGHCCVDVAGIPCRVGRLGYTGERGFELVAPSEAKQALWAALAARVRPAGFAAADILRIEAGFVLFANEFGPMVTAKEAGLQRFGRVAEATPPRVELVGFTAQCRERPVLYRADHGIRFPPHRGEIVVTSAGWSAALGCVVGLGYVKAGETQRPLADPCGAFRNVRIARLPLVDPEKRRVRGGWRQADLLPDLV